VLWGGGGVICNVRYPGGSFSFLAVVLSGSPVSVFLSAVYCWWANVFCGEEKSKNKC